MDLDRAGQWISRWDAQQQWYMPDREERFTVLIDAAEAGAGRDDPLVLDLGCGPGSLAVRLLDRMPAARVVAIDTDPLLLDLGRAAFAGRSGLRFVDQDMRRPGWAGALGLDRAADAAVSTTALHWLDAAQLRAMYAELATVLRPGGLMLDGDHLKEDEAAVPVLARSGTPSASEVPAGSAAMSTRKTGRPGGKRRPRTRNWPALPLSARGAGSVRTITARSRCCLCSTSRRCARPGSPRSARSGSTARTASSAPSPLPDRPGPPTARRASDAERPPRPFGGGAASTQRHGTMAL